MDILSKPIYTLKHTHISTKKLLLVSKRFVISPLLQQLQPIQSVIVVKLSAELEAYLGITCMSISVSI